MLVRRTVEILIRLREIFLLTNPLRSYQPDLKGIKRKCHSKGEMVLLRFCQYT